jgi:hypothetical protein
MKQPLISFWTVLGMRIEATLESARIVIRPAGGGGTGGGLPTYLFLSTICLKLPSFTKVTFYWGGGTGGRGQQGGGMGGGPEVGGQQGKGPGEGLPSGRRSWVPTSMPMPAANATGTR